MDDSSGIGGEVESRDDSAETDEGPCTTGEVGSVTCTAGMLCTLAASEV
jgi:hypothetical protein